MTIQEDALQAILKTLHHGNPESLRKPELLSLRKEVIRLAAGGITGEVLPTPRYCKPDREYERAVRLVQGYEGSNNFLRSLKVSIDSFGGLTPKQANAVLAGPYPEDIDNMKVEGIDPTSVRYHWQALDALRDLRARRRRGEA